MTSSVVDSAAAAAVAVARTIADLAGSDSVAREHDAAALVYRRAV